MDEERRLADRSRDESDLFSEDEKNAVGVSVSLASMTSLNFLLRSILNSFGLAEADFWLPLDQVVAGFSCCLSLRQRGNGKNDQRLLTSLYGS